MKPKATRARVFGQRLPTESVAARLEATPMAVALSWLLQRSPNILLIPGTSSVAHLRDNIKSAALTLSENELTQLNSIG